MELGRERRTGNPNLQDQVKKDIKRGAEGNVKGWPQSPGNCQGYRDFAERGRSPLYASSKDPAVWQQTMAQLHFYIKSLRKPNETVSIYYSVTKEKESAL
jgi:hypothetical protein